jgi:DNA polymerase III epsilon subunit-like protein
MFTRDLVIFDTETTGVDVAQHEIMQIAAIRLDKSTLQETDRFTSYCKVTRWENRSLESMQMTGIAEETLKDAPDMSVVLEQFERKFPQADIFLTAYNLVFDYVFLLDAYRKLGKTIPYDPHGIDIWPLAYFYWCQTPNHPINPNKPWGFSLADIASMLGIRPEGKFHDALTDCRVEAEVLRLLLKKLPFSS